MMRFSPTSPGAAETARSSISWIRSFSLLGALILSLAALFPAASHAQAQGAFAASRIDTVRGASGTSTTTTAGDDFYSKLGLLDVEILGDKQTPVIQPWTTAFGATGFYTNNATLNGVNKQDDYFMAASALIAYEPRLTDGVAGLFAIRQDVFRYDQLKALDFEYLEASAGASALVPGLPNTVATLRYVYTRLTGTDWNESFYQDHGIAGGLTTKWRYSETFSFVAGVNAQVSLDASPSSGRRDDYSAFAAIVCQPVEKVQLTAGYVGSYYRYGFAGRDDFNQVFRLGLVVRPVRWLWIGASVAYAFNRSDLDAFDYGAWTAGLGAGAEFHF